MIRAAVVAMIDEARCIGCTLCIQACPVDAIVGAAQLMHTVIARECTGCELCLPPCPVDCIRMADSGAQRRIAAERARRRSKQHRLRLEREANARLAANHPMGATDADVKRRTVQRAIERARQRLAQRNQSGK